MKFDRFDSQLGPVLVAADESGLRHVRLLDDAGPDEGWARDVEALAPAVRQLEEYFAGRRRRFELALAPQGTEFQLRVWSALVDIPYGETWSYAELARHIGDAGAVRAVGGANGRNPIPIIIPCHRVIAADGSIGGYALGSELKRQLLELEGASGAFTQAQLPI